MLSLALIVAAFVGAEEKEASPQEQLKAWGDEFVGTWVNETTLETDLPGLGKKGDTLSGEVTFKGVNGVYQGTWKGVVNGKPTDSGIAAIGWDASKKKVRVQWFTKNAATASATYTMKGDTWTSRFILYSPDGTKSIDNSRLTTTGDTHVFKFTNRKRGDEALPDKEETWTKK